ncbi:hypothetical protein [Vibrio sp. SCSIO 43169]|uniref:hypothetical protein n=1 Tax=Vibrio sp. SCSIO 43169 TaxID=2822801 RepID=UPI00204334B8|nr:hypothetical protein [Vibrio sp. SCSIO 43169]MCM5507162.1 hypothetical protein [Vibrio sp. SCSIO 43169]
MNNYIAAYLNDNGAVSVNSKTQEIVSMPLGSFPTFEQAVEHACDVLEGRIIGQGVLHRETGFGGILICNEPEFEQLKEVTKDAQK